VELIDNKGWGTIPTEYDTDLKKYKDLRANVDQDIREQYIGAEDFKDQFLDALFERQEANQLDRRRHQGYPNVPDDLRPGEDNDGIRNARENMRAQFYQNPINSAHFDTILELRSKISSVNVLQLQRVMPYFAFVSLVNEGVTAYTNFVVQNL
jgi:hypothetical protein